MQGAEAKYLNKKTVYLVRGHVKKAFAVRQTQTNMKIYQNHTQNFVPLT